MLNLEVEVPGEPVIEQRLLHVAGCQELEEGRGKQSQRQVKSMFRNQSSTWISFWIAHEFVIAVLLYLFPWLNLSAY